MIKRVASAVALAVLLVSAASAQSPPSADAAAPVEAPAAPPAATEPSPSAPAVPPTTGALPAPQPETATAVPETAEACIAAAADLATEAEGKTIPEDKLDQLDVLFSKMETLCDGNQFDAAMTVAKDIKSAHDGQ